MAMQALEHVAPSSAPCRDAAGVGDAAGTPARVLAWTPMRTYSSLNPNPNPRISSPAAATASAKRARPADAGADADVGGGAAAGGPRPGGYGTPLLGAGLAAGGGDRRLRQRLADSAERRVWQASGKAA